MTEQVITTPMTARWGRLVIRDDDGTIWVLCIAETGQPIALALDEEHTEALAGSLLNTPDGEEATIAPARLRRAIADHLAQQHPDATGHGGTGDGRALLEDAHALTDVVLGVLAGER